MTQYADMDVSRPINELPPGREPVETRVIPSARRAEVVEAVERIVRDGDAQVFWVCPCGRAR